MPNRRWACVLMREHGDWDMVLEDRRYRKVVQPLWENVDLGSLNCRDWPQNHPGVMAQIGGKCCWDD